MITGHGDDGYLFKNKPVADFSSNVWYGGLQPGLLAHLGSHLQQVDHYPDAGATKLQHLLAAATALQPEQVLVTNGATEAIYLVAQAFKNASTTVVIPAFAEYADACSLYGHEMHYMPWTAMQENTVFNTDLVFICNPDNPTGDVWPAAALLSLIKANPASIFIVDEAYINFTQHTTSLLPCLAAQPNLLLLRSLTKTCCIPGLRLGYLAGNIQLVNKIRRFKMPWSVNSLALEAGYYILENPGLFTIPLNGLLTATASFTEAVNAIDGYTAYPTHTHYFLFTCSKGTAADLKSWLIKEHGLLIRDAANFRGLTTQHCRVACQLPEHNNLLITALQQWMHT